MHKKPFKIFLSLSVIYLLLITPDAYANLIGNFKVSKKATKVHQRRTVGSGSRSTCIPSITNTNGIELLVPNISVAHQTSWENPSLFLYSRINQSVSVDFTLIDPQKSQPLIEKTVKIDDPGIVEIPISPNIKLKENNLYLWYIAIPCKNQPSNHQTVLSAGIEKIILPADITALLSKSTSNLEKIKIYSENGLWYETINLVIESKSEQEINNLLVNNLFLPPLKVEKDI